MKHFQILFFAAAVCAVGVLISGCESTEDDNIAKAQKCLDGLGPNPSSTDAQNCVQNILSDNSPNAEVVRCAADFIEGGITDTSLINAYNSVKNLSGPSVAQQLIPDLAIQYPTGTYDTAFAQSLYNDCVASETSSLVYIAGLAQTGTIMAAAAGSPSSAATYCSNPSNTSSCNPTAVGTIAQTVSSSYCTGSNQTSSVCTTLNNAIAQGNGNPTSIGTYLLQNL